MKIMEKTVPYTEGLAQYAGIMLACIAALLVSGCMPEMERNYRAEFDSCVIPKASLEAAIQRSPERKEQYSSYAAGFSFNKIRKCYEQRWSIPGPVFQVKTGDSPGEEQLYIQFPYTNKEGAQRSGWVEELAGINVLIRPIGTFLSFGSKNEFREARLGKPTGQTFLGHEVYLEKSERLNNLMRVLVQAEARDMVVFLELSPGGTKVSESDVGSLITVFTHVDDRFEISYTLVPRQLNEINSIDGKIKSQIRSFQKN